ncbi:hypothetical protein [Azospirillum agricola]|nr:hypothetical protein [Azospirillum agricola]SMH46066.1 hypothetical protein SAMN02982994_2333 [Azospirillum lipoferum]
MALIGGLGTPIPSAGLPRAWHDLARPAVGLSNRVLRQRKLVGGTA